MKVHKVCLFFICIITLTSCIKISNTIVYSYNTQLPIVPTDNNAVPLSSTQISNRTLSGEVENETTPVNPLQIDNITQDEILNSAILENYYPTILFSNRSEDPEFIFADPTLEKTYSWKLSAYELNPIRIENISDACKIIALVKSDIGEKVVNLNIDGTVGTTIFDLNEQNGDDVNLLPSLSPSGEYVAYVVLSGDLYFDSAQYQDINVVLLKSDNDKIRLSTKGGAANIGGQWSPTADEIVYSGKDDSGNLQVFITTFPEISTRQITQWKDNTISQIRGYWSTSGKELLLVTSHNALESEVFLYSTINRSIEKVMNLPKMRNIDKVFWSSDDRTILFSYENPDKGLLRTLLWFDKTSLTIYKQISERDIPNQNDSVTNISFPFPLSDDLHIIGFMGNHDEWFNIKIDSMEVAKLGWLGRSDWGIDMNIYYSSNNLSSCLQK